MAVAQTTPAAISASALATSINLLAHALVDEGGSSDGYQRTPLCGPVIVVAGVGFLAPLRCYRAKGPIPEEHH